jgi:hypothetical protein
MMAVSDVEVERVRRRVAVLAVWLPSRPVLMRSCRMQTRVYYGCMLVLCTDASFRAPSMRGYCARVVYAPVLIDSQASPRGLID